MTDGGGGDDDSDNNNNMLCDGDVESIAALDRILSVYVHATLWFEIEQKWQSKSKVRPMFFNWYIKCGTRAAINLFYFI